MHVGKIVQLTNVPVEEPTISAHATITPAMLLARIVRLETRLTDVALRLDAIEGVGKRTKGAK